MGWQNEITNFQALPNLLEISNIINKAKVDVVNYSQSLGITLRDEDLKKDIWLQVDMSKINSEETFTGIYTC